MAKGIDIAIAADTRSAMSAINRGLIDPLEDASELLETIGDDGKDATDKLERGMKDAQRRTDDARDEIRDLRDEVNKAGRAGKKAGDDISDGMRRAEDGAEEFKDEANSTAREAAASFDGSAESIADAFQEIAANAFAGFGPAGAIAGLAAAAGIGLAIGGIDALNQSAEEAQQWANDLAQAYIDAGGTVLDTITLSSRVADVLTDADQRKRAQELADLLGIELPEAARILAGDTNALATAYKSLGDEESRLQDTRDTGRLLDEEEAAALAERQNQLDQVREKLAAVAGANQYAQQTAKDHSDALLGMIADAGTATEEVDDLGNKLYTLPDGHQILIDADTKLATSNVDKFKGDVDSIPKSVTTKAFVEAYTRDAQNAVNGFIASNDGRSFRLHGRVTVDSGAVLD